MSLHSPQKKAMPLRLMKWNLISCNTNENIKLILACKEFYSTRYIRKHVATLPTEESDATKIDEVEGDFMQHTCKSLIH